MLVDALMKGKCKGKGKKGNGESKETKSDDDKGKSKGWKNRAKDSGDKSQDSKDSAQKKCFHCDCTEHAKSDCQQRAEDTRKATAAGRPFVDKSKKAPALQATDGTPPFVSVTLAPDFDGYLFAVTMDSSWNETLCPLMRPPTAQARRRANATPMSHGLSVFLLIDSGSAVAGCPRDWCPNIPAKNETVALPGRR